jgi:TRAP-type C4-dicarboxylate transport system permease large subunit
VLVAVPLFLLMGEILLRSGLSDRLYRALNTWFGGLPGGLLHTNIVACSIFSAVSGSSVATAATIGAVALPYFDRTGYSTRLVLGTIYAGVATPTEAAALGVVGAVALAALSRRLTLPVLHASVRATARTTSMIGLIILSAFALNFVLTRLRLPQTLATMVTELALPPWVIMAIIIVFYIALGTFMEGFSMMITTLPVVFPIVTALGYDPV